MNECYGNMDALMLSSKLSQFQTPGENLLSQSLRNYSIANSSIPAHVLQKWSLTSSWPVGLAMDQRHLAEATADLSRQYLWSKHLSSPQFHPYFNFSAGLEIPSSRMVKDG
jgi:hypothetical protein